VALLNYISETVNNNFMSRSTRFWAEYTITIVVILVASLSSYVAEVADPTVEAINREIYVDKFDNINRGIALTDPGEQCRIGV